MGEGSRGVRAGTEGERIGELIADTHTEDVSVTPPIVSGGVSKATTLSEGGGSSSILGCILAINALSDIDEEGGPIATRRLNSADDLG